MQTHDVRTPDQALAYLVDCTLATVSDMAMKTRRPKFEFERQVGIAQTGIDWMRGMSVDFSGTRAQTIVSDFNGSVAKWANSYIEPTNTGS